MFDALRGSLSMMSKRMSQPLANKRFLKYLACPSSLGRCCELVSGFSMLHFLIHLTRSGLSDHIDNSNFELMHDVSSFAM